MKKYMKRLLALGMALGLCSAAAQRAWAVNPDQMTITMNIVAAVDVLIATTTTRWYNEENAAEFDPTDLPGGINLGDLTLGNTIYMVRPATVTVTTDFADTELDVQGIGEGAGLGAWTFDTDGFAEQNELQVYALFGPTSNGSVPAFATTYDDCTLLCNNDDNLGDQITNALRRYGDLAGDAAGDDGVFQDAGYAVASENINPASEDRHLWIRLDTPPSTTELGSKNFSIQITAQLTN